jgi:hypothetical protein
MPQTGHLPGCGCRILGCIGQLHTSAGVGVSCAVGSVVGRPRPSWAGWSTRSRVVDASATAGPG